MPFASSVSAPRASLASSRARLGALPPPGGSKKRFAALFRLGARPDAVARPLRAFVVAPRASAGASSSSPARSDLDVFLYDTTLRDGSQQVGISLTCDDKLAVASHLIDLGVAYVEGGYPASNPKDEAFFRRWFTEGLAEKAERNGVTLAAFGMTRRKGVEASEDEGLRALAECPAPCACVVAKAWDEQCERVLGVTLEENVRMIAESVAFLVRAGKEVIVDCEHFFDGHAANPAFAVRCATAAAEAGASHVVLCETNGGQLPWACEAATRDVVEALREKGLLERCGVGAHAHNDAALAVANSLAGVRGGARMVQGCVNGYGERTGNADVLVCAANLHLKMGLRCLPEGDAAIRRLKLTAERVANACGQKMDPKQPYVGSSAFAHKGGLHVAALAKMPMSYNHVAPEVVGNAARTVVSELSGRGNIVSAAQKAGIGSVSKETAAKVLAQIKELEARGFVLEDAGASVDILFRRADPNYAAPFNVLEFNVTAANNSFGGFEPNDYYDDDAEKEEGEKTDDDDNDDAANPVSDDLLRDVLPEDELIGRRMTGYKKGSVAVNQVVVKVELFDNDSLPGGPEEDGAEGRRREKRRNASRRRRDRETRLCVAEGNGPVNALANALRLALTEKYPELRRIHLRDYKVDLLSTEGTSAAVTRVTMDFADKDSDASWRTVGAHASIIEASFRALVDGMEYGIAQCGPDGCAVAYEDREATEEGNGALERGVGGGVGGGVGVGAP